jgi:phage-related protein
VKLAGTDKRLKVGGAEVYQPKVEDANQIIQITGEGDGVLRSQRSDQKVNNIKFRNRTTVRIDLIWIDFKGNEVKGGVIPPGVSMNGNTYVTHPFKAKVSGTDEVLKINGQEVYQPQVGDSGQNIDITGKGDDVLRSIESTQKVNNIKFKNTVNEAVEMFWIDFKGKEVSYGKLPKNGIMNMSTFVTHPWVVKLAGTDKRIKIGGAEVF